MHNARRSFELLVPRTAAQGSFWGKIVSTSTLAHSRINPPGGECFNTFSVNYYLTPRPIHAWCYAPYVGLPNLLFATRALLRKKFARSPETTLLHTTTREKKTIKKRGGLILEGNACFFFPERHTHAYGRSLNRFCNYETLAVPPKQPTKKAQEASVENPLSCASERFTSASRSWKKLTCNTTRLRICAKMKDSAYESGYLRNERHGRERTDYPLSYIGACGTRLCFQLSESLCLV